jgi:hypothetical protein
MALSPMKLAWYCGHSFASPHRPALPIWLCPTLWGVGTGVGTFWLQEKQLLPLCPTTASAREGKNRRWTPSQCTSLRGAEQTFHDSSTPILFPSRICRAMGSYQHANLYQSCSAKAGTSIVLVQHIQAQAWPNILGRQDIPAATCSDDGECTDATAMWLLR